jgi:hypothetical protein
LGEANQIVEVGKREDKKIAEADREEGYSVSQSLR